MTTTLDRRTDGSPTTAGDAPTRAAAPSSPRKPVLAASGGPAVRPPTAAHLSD